jgi:hypothetical protein
MSKLEEKINFYFTKMKEIDTDFNTELLEKITRSLVPSIFNKDAETVSCSNDKELQTVKNSFLRKKLGIEDVNAIENAVQEICEKMGKSNRNKYRVLFYYFLVKKFGKEDIYS